MRLLSAQLPSDVELSPWLWVAGGALVLLVVLVPAWWIAHRRARRRAGAAACVQGLEGDLTALMRELSTMIAGARAQLDQRAERIDRLLRAADERIERLERLESPRSNNGDGRHPSPDPAAPQVDAAAEVDPRHAQVYALSEDGLSAHQIADQLGRPRGEVELILALRPRGRAAV